MPRHKITYTFLIRPVLEYGFQIYHVASASNLKKLEIVQLSAAGIINGLMHCCPCDIVLYESDLRDLNLRRQIVRNILQHLKVLDPITELQSSYRIGETTTGRRIALLV
ncbi:uncharacterized protein NPIL_106221 [Nephila pilipes]|uniref:Uncharacterized protein n=1 Tax=Nephila pilipes TaxID=299642 RepID=A0A8X6MSU0_NEPPI|nr:uncharacterized protein NPIL_106221 [Nephila pilipes]